MRQKISTTVYITAEQDARLKELNAKTKVPVAEYIRQGIDLVLDRYRDNLPGQVSLFDRLPAPPPPPVAIAPAAAAETAEEPRTKRAARKPR
jgi:Ribbon-helix-helix domain